MLVHAQKSSHMAHCWLIENTTSVWTINSQSNVNGSIEDNEAQIEKSEISQVVGLSKSTVGGILKKQVNTGQLENGKQTGRQRSTCLVDKIICTVKKNCAGFRGSWLLLTMHLYMFPCQQLREDFKNQNLRGFTTRWKPLISLKNTKARLQFTNHKQNCYGGGTKFYGLRKRKLTSVKMMKKRKVWRKEGTAHDPKHRLICQTV